jgi:TonB family protein
LALGSGLDAGKYYPPDAERQGIEGMVDIQVTLDAQSHVTDTLIREEHPANMGFGAAASALAHVMEFDNPTGHAAQRKRLLSAVLTSREGD